jgi:hypothetical protein
MLWIIRYEENWDMQSYKFMSDASNAWSVIRKLLFICLMFMGLSALAVTGAFAAGVQTVTSIQSLEFGGWQIPASGTNTVTVSTAGVLSTTGGPVAITGTSIIPARSGQFLIRQTSGAGKIKITVTSSDTSRLNNFTLKYDGKTISNGQDKLANPTNTGKTLIVGGTLNLSSTLADGVYPTTPNYIITVTN